MRSPRLTRYDIKRSFEVAAGWFTSSEGNERAPLPANLTVVSPLMIPFNGMPAVRSINRLSVKRTVTSRLTELQMHDPLIITTFPCTCDFVGDFGERLHIYYCVDDFVSWPGVDRRLIAAMEDALIARSDLVLASAEALCLAKERNGKRPALLAHGVDFEHFHAALSCGDRPKRMRTIPGPIIGFFGALSAWLDYELLVMIARQRPDWSLVFIGPVDTDISILAGIPNIHLLGKVAYDDLPAYAACFDVGIIPFKANELTRSVNPLKLMEYLSLGIPVVSSYMPEVAKYAEIVSIAHHQEEFLAAIARSLDQDTAEQRQKRLQTARAHSWSAVAERFSALVMDAAGLAAARKMARAV
jgi:glycosyltransferase involved in cell wall biosynthesis